MHDTPHSARKQIHEIVHQSGSCDESTTRNFSKVKRHCVNFIKTQLQQHLHSKTISPLHQTWQKSSHNSSTQLHKNTSNVTNSIRNSYGRPIANQLKKPMQACSIYSTDSLEQSYQLHTKDLSLITKWLKTGFIQSTRPHSNNIYLTQ